MKAKTRADKTSAKKKGGWLSSALKGAGFGLAATFLLILLFCAVAASMEHPGPMILPLALCALYIGGVIAGAVGARASKGGVLGGLLAGCGMLLAVLLLSVLPFPLSGLPVSASMIFLALLLPAGALGGILGTKKQQKRRIRR